MKLQDRLEELKGETVKLTTETGSGWILIAKVEPRFYTDLEQLQKEYTENIREWVKKLHDQLENLPKRKREQEHNLQRLRNEKKRLSLKEEDILTAYRADIKRIEVELAKLDEKLQEPPTHRRSRAEIEKHRLAIYRAKETFIRRRGRVERRKKKELEELELQFIGLNGKLRRAEALLEKTLHNEQTIPGMLERREKRLESFTPLLQREIVEECNGHTYYSRGLKVIYVKGGESGRFWDKGEVDHWRDTGEYPAQEAQA